MTGLFQPFRPLLCFLGSNQLYFSYDAFGTPQAVVYNGTQYRYITNLQGDIVEIRDANDSTVVAYTYDAWGKLLTTTGTKANTLGAHNPLRYRGYVYDTETGLYYLQSRYYNPTIGRFINADSSISTGQGNLGNNMFAYCLNNPANGCDPCGTCFHRWDFWNDCEKCGGETLDEKMEQVSITWNKIARPVVDFVDTVLYRIEYMDWEEVAKDSIVAAVADGAAGATTGYVAGLWGVPITEGLSLPACALVGGVIGFTGGIVSGFITSFVEEFQAVEAP